MSRLPFFICLRLFLKCGIIHVDMELKLMTGMNHMNEFNERPIESERATALSFVNQLMEKSVESKDLETYSKLKEIKKLVDTKKYGLVWEEHAEFVSENEGFFPVLTEKSDRMINDQMESTDFNFLIEGDNYFTLELLEKTSAGTVDVIYIDPPYNTGKDRIYNDTIVKQDDQFRHSKWVSVMYRRLKIAKKLLSKNGVMFVSIDDREYQNMKFILDELFTENGFVTNLIWKKKTGAHDAKGIAGVTEYILVYTNNLNKADWNDIFVQDPEAHDDKRFNLSDEYVERRGRYYLDSLDRGGLTYSDSMNYPIEAPDGTMLYPNGRTEFENDGWIWQWSRETFDWGVENGFIEITPSTRKANGWSVRYKNYLLVDHDDEPFNKTSPYNNLIQDVLNTDATTELKKLFDNKKVFDNPKPVKLIKKLLKWVNKENALVLDFFAGSGTTAQAVLELNEEDGQNRRFIVATNNENGIAEKVTYERIKRVSTGVSGSKNSKRIRNLYTSSAVSGQNFVDKMRTELEKAQSMLDEFKTNNPEKKIKPKFNVDNNVLSLDIEETVNGVYPAHPTNLKYFKVEFVEDDEDTLEDELLAHVAAMVELENGTGLNANGKYAIVTSLDQVKDVAKDEQLQVLYIRSRVHDMLSNGELSELDALGVQLVDIPERYFAMELRGLI
ncbi:site-specific DNA-methyltransferase [Weissella cibaria]|uniref:site-specific DNA-methyltransferase n=1 Tax=Weissella cibaria TaxID=137591 RepID=UPI001C1F7010|nr:site-specific DNA-methyltransferase [Weissella cibaria]MBU7544758.1 site-specific DNA-methyltransferase [Weissella cibaria]MCV3317735.1 site-specific DNA-methyltransferase [Weissella cibaria]